MIFRGLAHSYEKSARVVKMQLLFYNVKYIVMLLLMDDPKCEWLF